MAVDTPARILVIGAGPIGLEAALYGRFLGYEVAVCERGRVAENVLRQAEETLSTPWRENVTPLGLAALRAQDTLWQPPVGDLLLSNREWASRYLVPLSQSDLLADNLFEQTEILEVIHRADEPAEQATPQEQDDDSEDEQDGPDEPTLNVRVRDAAGHERTEPAHVVIDASGAERGSVVRVEGTGIGYYVLGAKSFIGRTDFQVSIGHLQIRDLFAIIGDRADLDLYKSMARAEL